MSAILLSVNGIHQLDLSPAIAVIAPIAAKCEAMDVQALTKTQLRFEIDYPLEPGDPRELSEIPEIRLWFLRLDAEYPWLPIVLDWEAGELGRYAAMLVPHQFSAKDGIRYNPEALELFVMGKTFLLLKWMKKNQITRRTRLKFMTQMLGYELDDGFFDLLGVQDD